MMADAWSQLASEYDDNKDILIGKIDCTRDHSRNLCQQFGVEGYPTLKYGDIVNLQEYQGQRGLSDLNEVVEEYLEPAPLCGVSHPQLCDFNKRQSIEDLIYMGLAKLDKEIAKVEEVEARLEKKKDKFVTKLRESYAKKQEERDEAKKAITDEFNLDLARACVAVKKQQLKEMEGATA